MHKFNPLKIIHKISITSLILTVILFIGQSSNVIAVTNTARIDSPTLDNNSSNNVASAQNYITTSTNLTVTKEVDTAIHTQNDIINYKFIYRNLGVSDATDVVLVDTMPTELEYISAIRVSAGNTQTPISPQVDSSAPNTKLIFTLPRLNAYVEEYILVKAKLINFGDNIVNQVSIYSHESDPEISNNLSSVKIKGLKANPNPIEKIQYILENFMLPRTGGYSFVPVFQVGFLALIIVSSLKISFSKPNRSEYDK